MTIRARLSSRPLDDPLLPPWRAGCIPDCVEVSSRRCVVSDFAFGSSLFDVSAAGDTLLESTDDDEAG